MSSLSIIVSGNIFFSKFDGKIYNMPTNHTLKAASLNKRKLECVTRAYARDFVGATPKELDSNIRDGSFFNILLILKFII
jgi:hypothetical protein